MDPDEALFGLHELKEKGEPLGGLHQRNHICKVNRKSTFYTFNKMAIHASLQCTQNMQL